MYSFTPSPQFEDCSNDVDCLAAIHRQLHQANQDARQLTELIRQQNQLVRQLVDFGPAESLPFKIFSWFVLIVSVFASAIWLYNIFTTTQFPRRAMQTFQQSRVYRAWQRRHGLQTCVQRSAAALRRMMRERRANRYERMPLVRDPVDQQPAAVCLNIRSDEIMMDAVNSTVMFSSGQGSNLVDHMEVRASIEQPETSVILEQPKPSMIPTGRRARARHLSNVKTEV